MLLEQKGIDASLNIKGRFSLKKEDRDAYFLLPDAPCKMKKILLKNATVSGNTETADILWLELYRMGDCYYLEIFDDECRTLKVSFDDLSCGTHFLSALPLASCCKSSYEALTRVSSHILEKHLYDPSILCESEKELLPCIKLFAHLCTSHPIENDDAIEARSLFKEAGIEQGLKLLKDDSYCSNEKKALSISKKLARLLKSKKCDPLKKVLLERILLSQEHIGI
ncbi:MAG: hypothetical protein IJD22_07740 [Clostridia bacterium]|nr:hypothetical protein [Clostridia bacterium]